MINRVQALSNSKVILDNTDMTAVIPLSKEAAQYWADGTSWSLNIERENDFIKQNENAPQLVICFNEIGEKWLLRVSRGEVFLRDSNSHDLEAHDVDLHWDLVSNLFLKAVTINDQVAELIPAYRRNDQHLSNAVEQNVEEEIRDQNYSTTELCLRQIAKMPGNIFRVPFHLLSKEMCLAAVEKNGDCLSIIPVPFRCESVCRAAVNNTARAFKSVPIKLRDGELTEIACAKDPQVIRFARLQALSQGVLERIVADRPMIIHYMSTNERLKTLITERLCLVANENCGGFALLSYFPLEYRTEEVCEASVSMSGRNLQEVPEALRTAKMCMKAVKQDGAALEYVPDNLKTRDLCLAAVTNLGRAIEFTPLNRRLDEGLWLATVTQDGSMLEYVPEHIRTDAIYLAAVKENASALRLVPSYLMRELIPIALETSPYALSFIPNELKTTEMCIDAVQRNGRMLQYVPERLMTEELCWLALGQYEFAMQHIPHTFQTVEMCKQALQKSRTSIDHMRSDLQAHFIKPKPASWLDDPIFAPLLAN